MAVPNQNINAGTRLFSMFLDHFFMCIIGMVFWFPMIIKESAGAFELTHEQMAPVFVSGPLLYVALFGLSLYICKDCINGRSLAKRIFRHQVVNNATGLAASPLRCLVRNFFCFIWPVEFIVTLASPARRLGDRVAGTRVASYSNGIEQPGIKPFRVLAAVLISYSLCLLFIIPIQSIQSSFKPVKYEEASCNMRDSKALEQIFSDSLGSMLTASIRVYDKTAYPGIKYISVVCKLKENYLEEDRSAEALTDAANNCLHILFPDSTFTGRAKFVYRRGGSMKAVIMDIGIPVK